MGEDRIEMIKQMAREQLTALQEQRNDLIETADGLNVSEESDKNSIESMKAIFAIADQLTEAVRNCMEIKSPLTPEIVAIVSAMIAGITNAKGAREVEKLMAIRANSINSSKSTH